MSEVHNHPKKGEGVSHGMTEWFGLERSLKDHLIPTPCFRQEHLPVHQVAHGPNQPWHRLFRDGVTAMHTHLYPKDDPFTN